jgi:OmpA-OmpF porin, OOP family
MKNLILSAVATTGLLAASYALADGGLMGNATTGNGLYLSAAGGTAWTPDSALTKSGVKAKVSYNLGANGLFAVGYRYNNWRADGTLGYIYNNADNVKFSGAQTDNTKHKANGHLSIVTYLINGYYDIDTSSNLVPYVGAGVGGAYLDLDGKVKTDGVSAKGTDNVFAYQGIVGLGYQITPNWRADANYHYLGMAKATFTGKVNGGNTKYRLSDTFKTNLFNVGVSYFFT